MVDLNLSFEFFILLCIFLAGLLTVTVYFRGKLLKFLKYNTPNDLIQLVVNTLNQRIKELNGKVEDSISKLETYFLKVEELKEKEEENSEKIRELADGLKDTLRAQVNLARMLRVLDEKVLGLSRKVEKNIFKQSLPEKKFDVEKGSKFLSLTRNHGMGLAGLTPTEMKVLRVLATSGPKTASEIREVIGKTREHSARLMKKLFLEGYVERDTSTIPYLYKLSSRIKENFEFSTTKEKP